MNKIPVIALIIMLVAVACGHDSRLDTADALMYPEPHKALALLDSIDPAGLRGEADRARYALLYTKAQNKCHIYPTSDSLINIAVSYYDRSGHDSLRMLAHLYRSVIRNSAAAYHAALRDGLLAKDIAEQLDMPYWVARASQEIADAYYQSYDMDNSIRYSDIAARNFTRTGYHLNSHYVTVDKAVALSHRGRYQESLRILDSMTNIVDTTDLDIITYVWTGYLRPLNALNRSAEAIEYARKAMKMEPVMFYDPMIDYADIAISYMQTGQNDSADYYLKIAEDRNTPTVPYAKAWHLAKIKDYEGAFELMRTYNSKHSAMLNDLINNSITIEEKEFVSDKAQNDIEHNRHIVWLVICIATVVVLMLILLILHIRSRNKLKRIILERQLSDAIDALAELNRNNDQPSPQPAAAADPDNDDAARKELAVLIGELFKAQFSKINDIYEKYIENLENNKIDKANSLARRIDKQLSEIISTESIQSMQSVINRYRNNFLVRLADQIKVTDDDLKLITLIMSGLSYKTISTLLKIEPPTFYTRTRRLRNKINLSNAPDTQEFLAALQTDAVNKTTKSCVKTVSKQPKSGQKTE